MRKITKFGIGGTLTAVAALIGSALPAQASSAPAWHQAYSKYFGPATNDYSTFDSVVALGNEDVWVLGGADASGGNGTTPQALAVQWTRTGWTGNKITVKVPDTIAAASASGANNVWAVTGGGYVLRYNGSAWSVAKKFSGFGQLTGVTAFASNNVWVYGGPGANPGFGTWHYNGSTWTHVTGTYAAVETASALNSKDIWATAASSVAPESAIVHYNGSTWGPVTLKGIPSGQWQLSGIYAVTDKSVWVTANLYESSNSSNHPYLLHFNGTSWTASALPWTVPSNGVTGLSVPAPDGSGGLWFAGWYGQNSSNGSFTRTNYVLHRAANGAWSRTKTGYENDIFSSSGKGTLTTSGAGLSDIALVPGTKSAAAAGDAPSKTGSTSSAVVWTYGNI